MTDGQQTILTPDDGLADLRRLSEALDRAVAEGHGDELVAPGSDFDLSETIQHSAQSIGYAMTGYPELKPAIVRRTVGRAAKHTFLGRGRMKHNLSAPVPGAPELDGSESVEEALAQLREVISALGAYTGTLHAHPVYGQCTKEQAARLQAMHLREHLPGLAAFVRTAW